jgi:plasmid stabilization system protein ParE
MSYRIRFAQAAEMDLRQTHAYISNELHNPVAANRLLSNIDQALLRLANGSGGHKLVDDDYLAAKGVRRLIVHNYLVFFLIKEDTQSVYILRILYGCGTG